MHSSRTVSSVLVLFAVLVTTLLPYQEAHATRWEARREAWLAGRALQSDSYRLTDQTIGYLGYRKNTFVKVYMFAGVPTGVFVAGCKDAYRIGIDIYDPQGRYLGSDNRATHRPYQHVNPGLTGWYWIRVHMNDATKNGAHYAVVMGTK